MMSYNDVSVQCGLTNDIAHRVPHTKSVMPTGKRYKTKVLSQVFKTNFVVQFTILLKEKLISN